MSRGGMGEVQTTKPVSNVYTVLTIVSTLAVALAIFVIYKQTKVLFGPEVLPF